MHGFTCFRIDFVVLNTITYYTIEFIIGTGYLCGIHINRYGNRINIRIFPGRLFIRPPTWTVRRRRDTTAAGHLTTSTLSSIGNHGSPVG